VPFLALGGLIALFGGRPLVDAYVGSLAYLAPPALGSPVGTATVIPTACAVAGGRASVRARATRGLSDHPPLLLS
jgi:hypothetical protein